MPSEHQATPPDADLESVIRAISGFVKAERRSPVEFWGALIRRALDEVIDGPRTSRWSLDQLSNTEQTYVGTKVEILVRNSLELEPGLETDVRIQGVDVDVKWSKSLEWQIGPENVGKICLGLGLSAKRKHFSVGVFRASSQNLRAGRNRDRKTSLTASAFRSQVVWLVRDASLPPNFVEELAPSIRQQILAGRSAQERIRLLAQLVPGVSIPRIAFETVARDKRDPMRRLRRDASRPNPLGGMVLLSTKYSRAELTALGFGDLPSDHWVAVPEADVNNLSR
jgi:hypothetical protein